MKFTGILPALVTPFGADNKTINEDTTKKLIEYHLSQGADGFYILGGTGEGPVVARPQRERMCEIAVECVAHRKPVICHIASMNFEEAVLLAKHAERTGADAIAAIPPLFFHYSDNDIYNYYKKLADAVHIPLIIYYHPAAQKSMSATLIARIYEIDNVTGVKWSSTDFFEMMKLKDITHGEMNIINGPDELLVSGLAAGADAGVGSTYNVMLPQFKEIYNLFQAGKMDEALKVQLDVNRKIQVMLKHELIPSIKHHLKMLGFDCGNATLPMLQYTKEQADAYEKEIALF